VIAWRRCGSLRRTRIYETARHHAKWAMITPETGPRVFDDIANPKPTTILLGDLSQTKKYALNAAKQRPDARLVI